MLLGSTSASWPAQVSCRGNAGQGKGHILSDLKEGDTWLEFAVQFKGEESPHWVKEEWLDCDRLVSSCGECFRVSGLGLRAQG